MECEVCKQVRACNMQKSLLPIYMQNCLEPLTKYYLMKVREDGRYILDMYI